MKLAAWCAVAMFAAGCGDDETRGQPDAAATDAATDATLADAGIRPASGAHRVYLAFDGVALTKGDVDDATTNTSSFIPMSGTLSPLFPADPARAAKIERIVSEMNQIVADYDLELVTTRPSSGPYDMIVFGGTGQEIGYEPNFVLVSGAATDCGDAVANNIVFKHREVGPPVTELREYAQQAIAVLALAHGIPVTTEPSDCLCYPPHLLSSECDWSKRCTFAGPGAPTYAMCGATGTQDSAALMLAEFGARP